MTSTFGGSSLSSSSLLSCPVAGAEGAAEPEAKEKPELPVFELPVPILPNENAGFALSGFKDPKVKPAGLAESDELFPNENPVDFSSAFAPEPKENVAEGVFSSDFPKENPLEGVFSSDFPKENPVAAGLSSVFPKEKPDFFSSMGLSEPSVSGFEPEPKEKPVDLDSAGFSDDPKANPELDPNLTGSDFSSGLAPKTAPKSGFDGLSFLFSLEFEPDFEGVADFSRLGNLTSISLRYFS